VTPSDNQYTVSRSLYAGSEVEFLFNQTSCVLLGSYGPTGIAVGYRGDLYVSQQDYVSRIDSDTGTKVAYFRSADYGFGILSSLVDGHPFGIRS